MQLLARRGLPFGGLARHDLAICASADGERLARHGLPFGGLVRRRSKTAGGSAKVKVEPEGGTFLTANLT